MKEKLSTDPYKGTRDFYPEDMAIQRYIFDTWAKTAESFGYQRYDASVLEPSELYKSKGAENEEMVNEQTYTFTDRGDREVTLRPEMTPTVARMVAGKRRDLTLPIRWYSIPNLFRYERMQRGRLREHWQLNCDMFGADDVSADVEMIALAYHTLIAFGATPDMFEIRINNRRIFPEAVRELAKKVGSKIDDNQISQMVRLMDKQGKMETIDFEHAMTKLVGPDLTEVLFELYAKKAGKVDYGESASFKDLLAISKGLVEVGVPNAKFDPNIMRGFDYYTGTIFEIFDTSGENNRSLIGGGRYDNLTGMFGGDPISGIGFGMGDVTMRDFLETHGLLEGKVAPTAPTLMVIPEDAERNIEGEKIAQEFRTAGIRTAVDISTRKLDKKKASAEKNGSEYILVVGKENLASQSFTLKKLSDRTEIVGTLDTIIKSLA